MTVYILIPRNLLHRGSLWYGGGSAEMSERWDAFDFPYCSEFFFNDFTRALKMCDSLTIIQLAYHVHWRYTHTLTDSYTWLHVTADSTFHGHITLSTSHLLHCTMLNPDGPCTGPKKKTARHMHVLDGAPTTLLHLDWALFPKAHAPASYCTPWCSSVPL